MVQVQFLAWKHQPATAKAGTEEDPVRLAAATPDEPWEAI
jgi:hypothetical protein